MGASVRRSDWRRTEAPKIRHFGPKHKDKEK